MNKGESAEKGNRKVQEQPDGGWGWLIVIGGMYALAMWGGIVRCYSVFFGPLMDEFGVEYGQVSWLTGMFQISYGLSTAVGSIVMKIFEIRTINLFAAITCGFSCFVASFCPQLWQVQVFMSLIVGFSMGQVLITTFTVVSRYFSKKLHAANQLLCIGQSLGPLLICPGYQLLIDTYGWRGACQIAAGLFLNMAIGSALMRPIVLQSDFDTDYMEEKDSSRRSSDSTKLTKETKPVHVASRISELKALELEIVGNQSVGMQTPTLSRRKFNDRVNNNLPLGEKNCGHVENLDEKGVLIDSIIVSTLPQDEVEGDADKYSKSKQTFGRICRKYDLILFADPLFYAFTFAWIGFGAAYFSAFTYIIPYGKSVIGLSELQASTMISAFAGGEVFSRVLYGFLFDRTPKHVRMPFVAGVFAAFSVGVYLFPLIRGHTATMLFCCGLGMLGGGMDGIFSAFIVEIYNVRMYASVFGYGNILIHSTGMATTVLIGAAVDAFENLAVPFYIGGTTVAFSSIMTLLTHRLATRRQKEAANCDVVAEEEA